MGVFIRSIYRKKEVDAISDFSYGWMQSNLTQEGMEKVLDGMKKHSSSLKPKPKTKEEIGSEWTRLASFAQKR